MVRIFGTRQAGRPAARPRAGGRLFNGALPCLALAGAIAACGPSEGPAPPEPQPDVDTLRASFIAQIESIDLVADLEVDGDEVRFVRPDGSGEDVEWRVRIDSLDVESGEGDGAQVGRPRAVVLDGERPPDHGLGGSLRTGNGHAQLGFWRSVWATECYALWDDQAKAWGWT